MFFFYLEGSGIASPSLYEGCSEYLRDMPMSVVAGSLVPSGGYLVCFLGHGYEGAHSARVELSLQYCS